jgi:hypothetical protein
MPFFVNFMFHKVFSPRNAILAGQWLGNHGVNITSGNLTISTVIKSQQ